jgi:hypothetical protein
MSDSPRRISLPGGGDLAAVLTLYSNADEATHDVAMLHRAAREASHIRKLFPSLEDDDGSDLYIRIERIAFPDSTEPERYQATMARIDELAKRGLSVQGPRDATKELDAASDLACKRWTPVVDAALYLGMVLGFRMALSFAGSER